ncbi:MAG: hypothetical protein ACREAW_08245 [Nitrososphaera sp.]
MWIHAPLSRYKLFASEKHTIILVFALCVVLRVIPEIVAYPYPTGYDVVNYYIPVVANFEAHWSTVDGQFPMYVLLLHSVHLATGLPAQLVVAAVAVAVFGIFGTSVYYLGRSLMGLGVSQSMLLAAFVIFQMAVLRTAWDLHRDVFALAAMIFAFSLLGRKDAGWKGIAAILVLAVLTVAADRMIGALFCISLAAYAVITRRKVVVVTSVFAAGLLSILMIVSYSLSDAGASSIELSSETTPAFYNPQNLLVLFAVVNGLLVAPAAIGFLYMKNSLLKIPLLASLAGSFSWLAFSGVSLLVADRWIILSGIFLAIFAGYGIIQVVKNLPPRFHATVAGSVPAAFAIIGIAYATMPYDSPFVLYGATRADIQDFAPVTMQFNSLDVQDNDKMLSAIAWINQNTEQDVVIVGEKHWRGFMEVYLEDERKYRFSNNPQALAEALERRGQHVYLVRFDGSPAMFTVEDVAIR